MNEESDFISQLISQAKNNDLTESFNKEIKHGETKIQSIVPVASKDIKGFETYTFLDDKFGDIKGIPYASNNILVGLPNSGKSLLLQDIALNVSEKNKKVLYILSEEIFNSDGKRNDINMRLIKKIETKNMNIKNISENLIVLDTVKYSQYRIWENFVNAYRDIVESKGIELVLIDSLTLLEDNRAQLKNKLLELIRYNQTHNLTSIMVNQRTVEESDNLNMSGGISLSHLVDSVFILDYKKIWSGDAQMKQDMNVKQGETVNFFRILKSRLSKYEAKYFQYTISEDGFVILLDDVGEEIN